jgi:hypothetical protein
MFAILISAAISALKSAAAKLKSYEYRMVKAALLRRFVFRPFGSRPHIRPNLATNLPMGIVRHPIKILQKEGSTHLFVWGLLPSGSDFFCNQHHFRFAIIKPRQLDLRCSDEVIGVLRRMMLATSGLSARSTKYVTVDNSCDVREELPRNRNAANVKSTPRQLRWHPAPIEKPFGGHFLAEVPSCGEERLSEPVCLSSPWIEV